MGNKKNLVGKQFGKLIVKSLSNIGKHGKEYLCECECGNEKVIRGSTLTSGSVFGCGCQRGKQNIGKKHESFAVSKIGEIHNRLKIVDVEYVEKRNQYYMICKCNCGNKTKNIYAELVSGKVKSCGCWQKEQASIIGSIVGLNNGTKNCSKRKWFFNKNDNLIKMRSGFEVMYALVLEKEGIDWEYEPNTFKLLNGVRYTPDFFLPKENLWIDVKGQLTEKHKIKHKLFREFGYDLKLVFIEELKSRLGISYSKFKKVWDRNKV